jgi:CheY-like chemotaxis protein
MSNPDTKSDRKVRVLLVDDDPIFTAIAEARLASIGYETKAAADGVEALEMLDTEPFDAALVDLSMPRIDGFRLIALVRGAPRHRRLVIIVVTSRRDPDAWNEALALGANAFEMKPLDWKSFPARLETLLAGASEATLMQITEIAPSGRYH